MSGGVPKRVKISRTQRNTFCKSGGWGQQGLILCGGQRGKQGMCNYIKKRTNLKEVLVPFEEEAEEIQQILIKDEINVTGYDVSGVENGYIFYAFKTVGNGSISFDHPTGTASNPFELEVFVVGGGGGGGGSAANATALLGSNGAGGGGGGGQVNIKTLTYTSNVENISITVGGGGNGATFPQFFSNLSPGGVHTYSGSDGESSSIGTITSNGGKGGKSSMASVGAGGAFQSGGNSSGYNGGVTTYNGGTGWASSDAVAGGGAGTKAIGGDYDNGGTSGAPPQGPAGDGGAGVNTTNTPEIDTAWENILNAISLPVGAAGTGNGFGGGGGGGAADTGTPLNAGTGSDGGANGAEAGLEGVSGGVPTPATASSKTRAQNNNPINTQVSLDASANRGGGGGGSVSYAQGTPVLFTPPPPNINTFPLGNRVNFTPVDNTIQNAGDSPAVSAVEAGGRGGSGLVIFRFLENATTDKTVTKTVTKKRGRCSDGLNK